ncbi:type IV fimbrial biogenesis protein FimT [Dyella sp. OK004]|nr:type IV fimbrial biogenesis protein FimT [Dyella sp. OK004]
MRRSGREGFSLVELMIALAVASILAIVAAPGFRDMLRRNKVSGASNALLADIAYARSEAASRGGIVSICPSSDGLSCVTDGTAYEGGWLVYTYSPGNGVANTTYDSTKPTTNILLRSNGARDGVSIQALDKVILSFGSQGQTLRSDTAQPKFETCSRPKGQTGTGVSTTVVPGAVLTVNPSGSVSSQSVGVQSSCVPT